MGEELKPGADLDELVAKTVFGLWNNPCPRFIAGHEYLEPLPYPKFSTDITRAMDVVEGLDRPMGVTRFRKDSWYVEFLCIRADYPDREELPNIGFHAEAKTLAHAICLAALKVVQAQQLEPKEKPESSCEPPG